jgi:hypothetical protein
MKRNGKRLTDAAENGGVFLSARFCRQKKGDNYASHPSAIAA